MQYMDDLCGVGNTISCLSPVGRSTSSSLFRVGWENGHEHGRGSDKCKLCNKLSKILNTAERHHLITLDIFRLDPNFWFIFEKWKHLLRREKKCHIKGTLLGKSHHGGSCIGELSLYWIINFLNTAHHSSIYGGIVHWRSKLHCRLRTTMIHRAHPTDVHSDIVLHWSWGFSGNWSGEVFSFLRTTIHGEAADLGGKGEIWGNNNSANITQ